MAKKPPKKIIESGPQNFPPTKIAMPYAAAYIHLNCIEKPALSITTLLDEANPKVTDGYGGWITVPRKKRVAIVTWDGSNPLRMTFGIFLDSWGPDALRPLKATIEEDCKALELMALHNRNTGQRPYTIKFDKDDGMPHADRTWVIDTLTWGDAIRNRDTGKRERQQATLVLLELVEDTTFRTLSPAKTRESALAPKGTMARPDTYTVKAGDTLGTIAAVLFGKESKWHQIAKAQSPVIRDPGGITVGQVLKHLRSIK